MKRILSLILSIVMILSVMSGMQFQVSAAVSGKEVVAYARQYIGKPYVWGGKGPNSFDCSGFVQYVFKHFGISLPATSNSYWNSPSSYGTIIDYGSTSKAQAGDVISWSGHVAIYTENGYCVEALNQKYGVCERFKVDSHTNGLDYRVIRIYGVTNVTDKTIPTITNVFVSNLNGDSFTINCTLNDNVGVTRVWLNIYGPGKSDGYSVSASNGSFSHTINTSLYGGAGLYSVHIYAFDADGNEAGYSINDINAITDHVAPKITNAFVSDVNEQNFTINCTLDDNVGVTRVWLNIYGPGKSDGYSVSASNGSFSHTINTSLYGGAGLYTVHIYAFDVVGNESGYAMNNINAQDHSHSYNNTVTTQSTCMTNGTVTYTCSCGDSYTEIIPATGHSYSAWKVTKKATYTATGTQTRTCSKCKTTETKTIAKLKTTAITKCTVTVKSATYTGKAVKPSLTIKNGKTTLKAGTHYTVSYKNNTKIGKATVTIKGVEKNGYSGTKTLTFSILPANVKNLKVASQTTSSIKLTWSKVSGATGYRVYKYDTANKKWVKVADTKNTNYTVSKLKAGTSYKYAVRAYTTVNKTTYWSASYPQLTTATKPATPTLKATAGTKQATLSWNKISGATGYEIWMTTKKDGSYSKVATIKKNATVKYTKKDLKKGSTYYFKVRAYKTVDGKNVYSAYSVVKNVKAK